MTALNKGVLAEDVGLIVIAVLMVLYMFPIFGVNRAARRLPLDNIWFGLICDRGHRNESSYESVWGRTTWQYHLAVLGCFAVATSSVYDDSALAPEAPAPAGVAAPAPAPAPLTEVRRHVWIHLATAAAVIGACLRTHASLEHRYLGKTSGDWVAAAPIVLFLRAAVEEVYLSRTSSRAKNSLHIILAAYCVTLATMCCRYSVFSMSLCSREPTGSVRVPLPVAQPMSGKGSIAAEAVAVQARKRKAKLKT